jgi:hypothetical protein
MGAGFLQRRFEGFSHWWAAPPTSRDRGLAIFVGGFGCFWIGLFGRFLIQPEGFNVDWWLLAPVAAGIVIGAFFPKATTVVCFPFSTFGGGPGT